MESEPQDDAWHEGRSELQAEDEVDDGVLTFVLGRYFSPHPEACLRDANHRPVCPGPLGHNHCLWKFAESKRNRAIMADPAGQRTRTFNSQKHVFGRTEREQTMRFLNERKAYYGVITPSNIVGTVHMSEEFNSHDIGRNGVWLQTVTLV